MNVNSVVVVGRLARDVEVGYTQGGAAFAKIGLAVNDKWKDSSGNHQEKTHFIDVTVWGKIAELCGQYLEKGQEAAVIGSLDYQEWTAPDGGKRSKLGVKASSVQFGAKPQGSQRNAPAGQRGGFNGQGESFDRGGGGYGRGSYQDQREFTGPDYGGDNVPF